MVEALVSGQVDALIAVVSLHTNFVEGLLSTGKYRLVAIPDHLALAEYIPGSLAVKMPSGVYGPKRTSPSGPTPASGGVRDTCGAIPLPPAAMAYSGRNDPVSADRFEIAAFFIASILGFASFV